MYIINIFVEMTPFRLKVFMKVIAKRDYIEFRIHFLVMFYPFSVSQLRFDYSVATDFSSPTTIPRQQPTRSRLTLLRPPSSPPLREGKQDKQFCKTKFEKNYQRQRAWTIVWYSVTRPEIRLNIFNLVCIN